MPGKRFEVFQFCKQESCKIADSVLIDMKNLYNWPKLDHLRTLKIDPYVVLKTEKSLIKFNLEVLDTAVPYQHY